MLTAFIGRIKPRIYLAFSRTAVDRCFGIHKTLRDHTQVGWLELLNFTQIVAEQERLLVAIVPKQILLARIDQVRNRGLNRRRQVRGHQVGSCVH